MSNMMSNFMKVAKPNLQHFWYYAKVELAPPKFSDIPLAIQGFSKILAAAKSGSWKNLTVKQGLLNGLVAIEVGGWFFIGEIIGKRHVIGYDLR